MPTLTGRCLCGDVRYEIAAPLGPIIYCHCSQCRRASGSAFASNAPVPARAFAIVSGQERLGQYQSSPDEVRAFCSRCGSPVYSRSDRAPDVVRVRLGLLDADPGGRAVAHIHAASKAPWFDITDDLPRFAAEEAPMTPQDPGSGSGPRRTMVGR